MLYLKEKNNEFEEAKAISGGSRVTPLPEVVIGKKRSNINWKIEYAKHATLKPFSLTMGNLKMDPHAPASMFGAIPDLMPILKSIPPN